MHTNENSMTLNAAGQTAVIYIPEIYSKIMVNVSGGADSAMLLWQVLTYLRQQDRILDEVRVLTGVDTLRPANEWNAVEIYLAIEEQFPEQNIYHDIFKYEKNGPKRDYHVAYETKLRDEQGFYCMLHGRTENPPIEEQKLITYNAYGKSPGSTMYTDASRPSERESTSTKNSISSWYNHRLETMLFFSAPFDNVNKKFIAELYKGEPYMIDQVYPLTASCVSDVSLDTNHWQSPCKQCWWCQERYWAFGSYDGGVQ